MSRLFNKVGKTPKNDIALELFNIALKYNMNLDVHRANSYLRASQNIENYINNGGVISSGQDAIKIKGVGKSMKSDIDRYLISGNIQRMKGDDDKQKVLTLFSDIYGVNMKTANRFYDLGYRTLEDLEKSNILNENQKIGLKYYNDLKERIPRDEIDQFYDIVKDIIDDLDEDIIWEITGSYRRMCESSGDIDILIQQDERNSNLMHYLLYSLQQYEMIESNLVLGNNTYRGIIKIRDKVRRLDISLCSPIEWPFELFHSTGSKNLNIRLKTRASNLGLELNQHGLFDKENDMMRVLDTDDEKDIFKWLGFEWLEPKDRNVDII